MALDPNAPRHAILALLAITLAAGCADAGESADAPAEDPAVETRPAATGTEMETDSVTLTVAEGLMGPESAAYDEAADVYLVSNVNGAPAEEDGNGFISRVSPDGTMAEPRWIEGGRNGVTLNAPKGIAIGDSLIYVTDIDVVRLFDRETGEPRGEWPIPNVTFANDVSVGPDGTVYVTDTAVRFTAGGAEGTGGDAVYRFDASGNATPLARTTDLQSPNGVLATEDGVVVVPFGGDQILRVGEDGALSTVARLPQGQLDGIVRTADGSYLVTSWGGSAVYRVAPDGAVTTAVEGIASPADLGWDGRRNRVLVPQLQENRLVIQTVSAGA